MFPDTSYDRDTLALLTRAFDDAWKDVQSALVVKPLAADILRRRLAMRLATAPRRAAAGSEGQGRL
jgi:hypothetical protein